MNREKTADLIAIVIIALAALLVAGVTFGVLQSQATGVSQGISVSGAIAGFMVTAILLFSQYCGLRAASGELVGLREDKQRLERKLVKGAPCPLGFELEVSDRQKVVLARPSEWDDQGGVLLAMQVPGSHCRPSDPYPAKFRFSFQTMTDEVRNPETYYLKLCEHARREVGEKFALDIGIEKIYVADRASLKLVVPEHFEVRWRKDLLTGTQVPNYSRISREAYEIAREGKPDLVASGIEANSLPTTAEAYALDEVGPGLAPTGIDPTPVSATPPDQLIRVKRMSVVCHHLEMKTIFWLEFWDDEEDFLASSELFNQIVASTRFLN